MEPFSKLSHLKGAEHPERAWWWTQRPEPLTALMPNTWAASTRRVFTQTETETQNVSFLQSLQTSSLTSGIYVTPSSARLNRAAAWKQTNTTSVSMSKTLDNTVTVRIHKMGQKYITAHRADTLMLFHYRTGSVESRSRGSIRQKLVQFMKSGAGRQTSGGHEVWWAWEVQQAQLKHWNIQTFYLDYHQDVKRWQFLHDHVKSVS